jgi:hypothetical protein
MCHFITATLAAEDGRSAVAIVAARFARVWEPLENPYVTAQLRRGEQYFLTTRGHCDCGTGLGAARRGPSLDRQIQKLKRKGWSSAKIERSLADKAGARKKKQAARRVQSDCWEQIIPSILVEAGVRHVGLLLHWYSGNLASERIEIVRQERVPAAQISAEFLSQIEEDVLYEFANSVA